MIKHSFDAILTQELLQDEGMTGVAVNEIAGGWELVEVYRDHDVIDREARGHILFLSSADLAALPPVAALIGALSALLEATDELEISADIPATTSVARAALAQFAEPE
jgi:hypothetical protein